MRLPGMPSRFFACVGLGVFLTFAASILAIFAQIGQINGNIVTRNIRMVQVATGDVGSATGVGPALYGAGPRNNPNTGLRQFYQWGLWNSCEKNSQGGTADFCTDTTWAQAFNPLPTILFDVPTQFETQVSNAIPTSVFTDDSYLSRYSKAAFYMLFIGTIAGFLAFVTGFLARRFAFLLAASFALFAFLCELVGCIIWTVIIARTRNAVNGSNSGLHVSYGNALWIYWSATGCLMFAVPPYLLGWIAGRNREYDY